MEPSRRKVAALELTSFRFILPECLQAAEDPYILIILPPPPRRLLLPLLLLLVLL